MRNKLKSIVVLTSLTTLTIHIINKIVCSLSTVKNKLTGSENHYYEWRFGKIRYTKSGSGTPLLLIHDLTLGSSQYEFHKLITSLSKNFEVYTLDLLGYGLSDKPKITYTNYLYVQQISDFIKNVIGKKTDMIATGDSAPISIMTCHNDPNIINKIILINPQSLYQLNTIPSKQTKALKLLMELPILGTFIYNLIASKNNIQKMFLERYIYNLSLLNIDDIETYIESSHLNDSSSRFSFSSYIGKYTNTNIIHALKEINNSIYIIGGQEKVDIQTIIENYIYYNISIESSMIPNTKHLPQLERPEELLKQIKLYLNY